MKLLMLANESGQVTLYDKIDSQRLEDASHAAARIHALLEDLAFGDSVSDALNELKEACQLTRTNLDLQHRKIERKAKAFLSDFYIFLEHWNTKAVRADREAHTDKVHDRRFKELQQDAKHNFPEYSFTYSLRNYAIHCDNIVAQIHGEIGCGHIIPMASRDFLLSSNRDWKGNDKKFLRGQPEYFDLIPIFEKACKAIQTIHYGMMDLLLSEQTISDCQVLMALRDDIKQLDAAPGVWDIIEFFGDKDQPLEPKDLLIISRGSYSRCYINWDVYPLLKKRATAILKSKAPI